MFRRLILEDSPAFDTVAAFATAFSIYATMAWRALRMRRETTARFENLPFAAATPPASHETDPSPHA